MEERIHVESKCGTEKEWKIKRICVQSVKRMRIGTNVSGDPVVIATDQTAAGRGR